MQNGKQAPSILSNMPTVADYDVESSGDLGAWPMEIGDIFAELDFALNPDHYKAMRAIANVEKVKVRSALDMGNLSGAIRIAKGIYRRFAGMVARGQYRYALNLRMAKEGKPAYRKAIADMNSCLARVEAELDDPEGNLDIAVTDGRLAIAILQGAINTQRRIYEAEMAARAEAVRAEEARLQLIKDRKLRQERNRRSRADANRRFAASCPSGEQGTQHRGGNKKGKKK